MNFFLKNFEKFNFFFFLKFGTKQRIRLVDSIKKFQCQRSGICININRRFDLILMRFTRLINHYYSNYTSPLIQQLYNIHAFEKRRRSQQQRVSRGSRSFNNQFYLVNKTIIPTFILLFTSLTHSLTHSYYLFRCSQYN